MLDECHSHEAPATILAERDSHVPAMPAVRPHAARVAGGPSNDLLLAYGDWLKMELKVLSHELYPGDSETRRFYLDHWGSGGNTPVEHFHLPPHGSGLTWKSVPQPSSRAAYVLDAVGCDWRGTIGRPAADPVDALWIEWLAAQHAIELLPTPEADDDDPGSTCSTLCRQVWAIEDKIAEAPPSPMRAVASTLIMLTYDTASDLKPADAVRGDASGDWLPLHVLASLRPILTGRLAQTVAEILDNPDRPIDPAGTLALRAAKATVLQAAE